MRLRCWALDDEMLKILSFLHERSVKLARHKDGETHMLQASKLYFLEAVDGKTFVYTKELVLDVPQGGLAQQIVLPDNAKTNPRGFLWIILADLEKAMPQLMNMVGMSGTETTLVGFIMLIFPMVFAIIMGNSLVAKRVDSGSMAYLLSAPVSRAKIVFTQIKVLGTGVFCWLRMPRWWALRSVMSLFLESSQSAVSFSLIWVCSCSICLSVASVSYSPVFLTKQNTASLLAPASPRWDISFR